MKLVLRDRKRFGNAYTCGVVYSDAKWHICERVFFQVLIILKTIRLLLVSCATWANTTNVECMTVLGHRNRITYPCSEYPLKPHFYIIKLGLAGVYLFSYFFLRKHRLWVLARLVQAVLICTHNLCFERKY